MKSLLFALGLALCCFVQANQDQRFEDIDHSTLPKEGIVTAMITNCKKMKEMLPHMKASPVSFKSVSEDEVKMTIVMAMPNGCKTMKPVLKRENGVFTTKCGRGGKKTVQFVQINENYMLTSIDVSHEKGECRIATLTVRNEADAAAAMSALTAFAGRHGLEGEKAHTLSTEGMCPRSS